MLIEKNPSIFIFFRLQPYIYIALILILLPLSSYADNTELQKEIQHLRQRVSQLRIDMQRSELRMQDAIKKLEQKINATHSSTPSLEEKLGQKEQENISEKTTTPNDNTITSTISNTSSIITTTSQQQVISPKKSNELYDRGIDFLVEADYENSQKSLTAFIAENPQNPLVPEAIYLLGEIFYFQSNFSLALTQYNKILSHYPNSDKAAHSLLKSGYTRLELEDYAGAKNVFNKVIQKYPNSKLSKDADQQRELLKELEE
jgi:tol-pal system protein YbgF